MHFLALLELYKLEVVDLDQPASFATLRVAANPDEAWSGSELADMEEYTVSESPADSEATP